MQKEFFKKWLEEHKYCVLATSSQDKPWAATVNYTVDDNFNIHICSSPRSLKFQNLLKNPNVCLVIDSQTREGTLQVQGVAESIKPRTPGEPNLLIKPKFLVFKKRDVSGKMKSLKFNL